MRRALTLVELLLTISILAFCLCGILLTYISMFILTDLSRQLTTTTNALQAKMEEIKRTDFDNLSALNGTSFNVSGFASSEAKGVIYVSNTAYTDLRRVHIELSFRTRGRVFGGDKNLNGVANIGEDYISVNGVNELRSPVESVTLISR